MRQLTYFPAVGLIAAAVLSCTASQDAATTTTPADAQAPSVIPVATDAAPADEAPTAPEDLKVFRMPTTPYLIPDPHHAFDAGSTQLVAELYSGLMRYRDYDDRIEVEGDLAESHSVSDDGLTYTFRLRNDLRYSDGSPVTAADFKWTWERALTEGTWERIFENLSPIEGAEALAAGDAETLTGVEVIDDRTLRVRLASPRHDFLMRMADPTAVVLSPANVERWGTEFRRVRGSVPGASVFEYRDLPAGTGPFRLVEYGFLNPIARLLPNKYYVHGTPRIDAVELRSDVRDFSMTGLRDFAYEVYEPDTLATLWDAMVSGEIHVLETDSDPSQAFPAKQSGEWVTWTAETGLVTSFIVFNPGLDPFDDLALRSALIAAYDPEPWSKSRNWPVPSSLAPETVAGDVGLLPQGAHDTANAGVLLSQSPHRKIDAITVQYDREHGDLVEFWHLFGSWREELGIAVDLVELSAWNFAGLEKQGLLGIATRQIKLVRPNPDLAYVAAADALAMISAGSSLAEPIRVLVQAAQAEPDDAQRSLLYDQIEDYLREHALVLPVKWESSFRYITTRADVTGLQTPRIYGSRLATVRIGD